MKKTLMFGLAMMVIAALALVPEGHAVIYEELYCNSSTNFKQHGAGSVLVVANGHCSYLLNDANQQLINVTGDPGSGVVYYDMVNYNNSQTSISGSPYGDNIWFTVRNESIDAYVDTNDISGWSRQATETTYQVAGYVGTLTNNIAFAHTAYQQYNLTLLIDYDNGHSGVLVNGVQSGANFSIESGGVGASVTIGTDYGNSGVIAWDKICVRDSSSEVGCPAVAPPASASVTLTAPSEGLKISAAGSGVFTFNFSLADYSYDPWCSLWVRRDGTSNHSKCMVSTHFTDDTNYSLTTGLSNCVPAPYDGTYLVHMNCSSNEEQTLNLTYSNNVTVYYDTTAPTVSVNPTNFFSADNSTMLGAPMVTPAFFNFTFSDNFDVYGVEVNVTDPDGNIALSVVNTSLNGTSQEWTYSSNIAGRKGNYTVNVTVYDSHTDKEIKDYKVKEEKDKLVFDDVITVYAPDAIESTATKLTDRYTFAFKYDKVKDREFVIETDDELTYKPDSGFVAHFVDWKNKRWIDFDGANLSYAVVKENKNKYKITFYDVPETVTFSSIGGLNQQTYLYTYQLVKDVEVEWTLPASGSNSIDLSTNTSGVRLQVTADYLNATTFRLYNSTQALINTTTIVATGSGSHEYNLTYYGLTQDIYYVNATHVDVYNNSNTSTTINLYRSIFDNCTYSTNYTARFFIRKENFPTEALVADAEFDITYWNVNTPAITSTYNVEILDNSTFTLCLYPTSVPVQANLYMKYVVDEGFTHRYYLQNYTFNNVTQNFTAYNHNTTTGISDLKVTTRQKSTYAYYPNVLVHLRRFYPGEGVYRVVQMDRTGDYGLASYNIIEKSQDYQLYFYDTSNNLLDSTDNLKFVCTDSVCDVTYLLTPYSGGTSTVNLTFSHSYNNVTGNITVTYNDLLGGTSSVRAVVTKETGAGTVTICDTTSTGASGTITCNVGTQKGDVLLRIFSSASPERAIYSSWVQVTTPFIGGTIGRLEGAFWSAAIMMTVVGFGLASGVLAIIVTVFGLIVVYFLGLFTPLNATFIIIAAIVGIVIGVKVRE